MNIFYLLAFIFLGFYGGRLFTAAITGLFRGELIIPAVGFLNMPHQVYVGAPAYIYSSLILAVGIPFTFHVLGFTKENKKGSSIFGLKAFLFILFTLLFGPAIRSLAVFSQSFTLLGLIGVIIQAGPFVCLFFMIKGEGRARDIFSIFLVIWIIIFGFFAAMGMGAGYHGEGSLQDWRSIKVELWMYGISIITGALILLGYWYLFYKRLSSHFEEVQQVASRNPDKPGS